MKRKASDELERDPLIGQTFFASDLLAPESHSADTCGRGGGFSAVLPVADDELDESIGVDSIDDGSVYLAFVRREAAARPLVARAAFPYPTPPAAARLPATNAPRGRLPGEPTDEWKASSVERFTRLRRVRHRACLNPSSSLQLLREAEDPPLPDEGHVLYTMPETEDEHAWQTWIRGSLRVDADLDASSVAASPIPPSASMLRLMPQSTCLLLLDWFTEWLRPCIETTANGPSTKLLPPAVRKAAAARSAAASPSKASPVPTLLQSVDAQWLFALLASLPDLLASHELGTIRSLARVCRTAAIYLSQLPAPTAGSEAATRLEHTASCWQIVAVVAGVWGQTDLWNVS